MDRDYSDASQTPSTSKLDEEHQELDIDDEEEPSQQMTQSYSEISFRSAPSPDLDVSATRQPPSSIPLTPLDLEGCVTMEGNMTHFVTEDLEQKLRLSSPVSKKDVPGKNSSLFRQIVVPNVGQFDAALINDLELEAQCMATSVDSLIENLSGILHSISSITADNVDVYKNAVTKTADVLDHNIKSMYTMMAKAEEITQAMRVVEQHSVKLKEIKKLVDLFETFV